MKKYSLKINGNQYEVKIDDINEASTLAHVTVNGTKYDVEIEGGKATGTKKPAVAPAPAATGLSVTPKTPIASKPVAAPAGQTLLVLEAMKMENNIDAERGGVVKQILVAAGATVMEGDVLIVIE